MDFKDDNRIQNDRLKSILDKLSPAQWSQDIGGGWSIGTMMCHLAFWDQLTSVRLRLWKEKGRLAVIPDEDNINSINDSLRFIFGAIDYEHGKTLVRKSADEVDSFAQKSDSRAPRGTGIDRSRQVVQAIVTSEPSPGTD